MTENKELFNKIGKIQEEISSLVKDETNKFQNYKYFEESQILGILKPLLTKYKVAICISDDDTQPFIHEKEITQAKGGGERTNHYLKYLKRLEITDLDNGSNN